MGWASAVGGGGGGRHEEGDEGRARREQRNVLDEMSRMIDTMENRRKAL